MMSRRLPTLIVLILTVAVFAGTARAAAPGKGSRPGLTRPPTPAEAAAAARVGGDTFDTALPFDAVPFTDTRSTIGYADDYDEFCGISVGTAPDVVYAFTPPASGWYRFDLCGSSYDTKLYIYDEARSLVACNDDFDVNAEEGTPCSLNARIADFFCAAGAVHYVVVDGFEASAGDYTLTVSSWTHCDVVPDGAAAAEGEPALASGQVDEFNRGCNGAGEPVYATITGDAAGVAAVALRHGWRDAGFRDFDEFRLTAGPTGSIHVEYESELESRIRIRTTTDCLDWESADTAVVVPCGSAVLNAVITPGTDFVISIMPMQYMPAWGFAPAEFDGMLRVTGLAVGVPTEGTSWGTIKGMFR